MTDRQWGVLFWVWIIGAVGFPIASAFGVQIDRAMLGGYAGIVSLVLLNHPRWRRRNRRAYDDEDDDEDNFHDGRHRR